MRRSPIVLTATVVGTAGVLAFHTHAPAAQTAAAAGVSRSGTTPRSTASAASPSSGHAAAVSGTATGDAVATRYGNAQVRVTVKGGRITDIAAVQLQGGDPRSVQISSSAEPTLQQEALTAQTARIDAVSGATFTSASYDQSLQSALDKLGFRAADRSVATLQVPQGGGRGL
jgi:uncharacterized protein with FMN-binding domain